MDEMRRKPMDDRTLDEAIRRLVDAAGSDAPDAPIVGYGTVFPNEAPTRRAPITAAAAIASVVVVLVVAATRTGNDVAGPADSTAAVPMASSTTGPAPTTSAAPPTTTAASRPIGGLAGASCVEEYGPATLAGRAWGFDGTVRSIAAYAEGALDTAVEFEVHEWFAIEGPPTVTVDMVAPQATSSVEAVEYGVGSRLLVSGEPRWGGDPLDAPVAWACGFTRTWDEPTASAWRGTFTERPPAEPASTLGRPITDPAVCAARSARDLARNGVSLFARPSSSPVLIQVIADPTLGPAGPFVLVQRYFSHEIQRGGPEPVEIDGVTYHLGVYDNGNGSIEWEIADGTVGYVRSRGLARDELLSVATALTPRLPNAPVPGFDVDDAKLPEPLGLLHEQLNTDVSGTVSESTCVVPATQLGYRISAVRGDPVFRYGGVIDRLVPLTVGIVDGTVVVIDGPDDPSAPTVSDIVEADEATWDDLLSAHP